MSERYRKNSGCVFTLKYHIVWCPKYRRSVLVKPVDGRLKQLLKEKSDELGMTDHVHLFVESDPTKCPAEIVNRLKG